MMLTTLDDRTWHRLQREHEAVVDQLVNDQLDRDEGGTGPTVRIGPGEMPDLEGSQATVMVAALGAEGALNAVRTGYTDATAARDALNAMQRLRVRPVPTDAAWWPAGVVVPTSGGHTWLANAHERGHLTADQVAELALLATRTNSRKPALRI